MADSLPPIDHLVRTSAKRAHALFTGDQAFALDDSVEARRSVSRQSRCASPRARKG